MEQAGFRQGADATAQETLEVFAFLACMGPQAFDPERALRMVCPPGADAGRVACVARITAVETREVVSWEVGSLLAEVLSHRARVSSLDLGEILPAILDADVGRGYEVLRNLAQAAPPALALSLGDILLNLALASRPEGPANGDGLTRLRILIEALALLPVVRRERTRLFLALSQTLRCDEAIDGVIASDLFPAHPEDVLQVLMEGNDDALRTLVRGVLAREGGRDEFMEACKAAMQLEPGTGIPLLARLDPLLHESEPGMRALESMVRGAVLARVERSLARSRHVALWMPSEPDARMLRLLSRVVSGLKEPGRTVACDWILERAAAHPLRDDHQSDATGALVEVIVGAALMHSDPPGAGARVRQFLLKEAASLRVRVLAVQTPTQEDLDRARAFERFAALLGSEFRRRRPLASALERILPHVTDLSRVPTDESPMLWPEDAPPLA